jgi:acyl-CoA synthetase (AMP-forming)/AMP-acid ligase II
MMPQMPRSIGEVIAHHASGNPNQPAILGTTFAAFSFGELDLWIKQIGMQLHAAGMGPRSRVGIMLPRGPEGSMLALAVASHAISVSLNPNRPDIEIEQELARLHLDTLVFPSWIDLPAAAVARRSSFGLTEASRAAGSLATIGLRQVREIPERCRTNIDADSVAVIFTTSGTTGTPKLVPVTLENLLVMADKMRRIWFNLSSQDRTAFVLPAYYRAPTTISLLAPLLLGGSVVLPTTPQVENLAEWVPQTRPTWLWGNPTFFQAVLDRLRAGGGLTHSLRFVVSGSAYLPPALRTQLEAALGVPVLQSYGMSETGILAADPAPPRKRKPGTTGLFSRDELAIIGPNGERLADGEVGEIVAYGRTVSPDIDADVKAQRSDDRRLLTGDLGSIDSDGYLTIVGRAKEMINRGGEKISPHEIENALLLHPSVREAAAFSVPHPRLGENVAAAVVLKSEADTTPHDVKAFLTAHLAPFKIPQNVLMVPELPKGPSGKISRSELSASMIRHTRGVKKIPRIPLEFQILGVWQALLCRNDIGVEDDFFELGGDSLLATSMILEVETVARRKIPLSMLTGIWTIRELAARIIETSDTSEEVLTCAKKGDGTPFFFCHGDFRTRGLWAIKLFEKSVRDQPVFLVNTPTNPDSNLTIEEIAGSRLPHMLAAHPTGPFRIGGFCNGGLIAWELAHQLESHGRRVERVVLIEAISLNARPTIRMIGRLTRLIAAVAPRRIGEKLKFDAMDAVWRGLRRFVFDGSYRRVISNYLPPRLNSDVAVVICEKSRARRSFSSKAWNYLVPNVQTRYIPGSHFSCITTHASELAYVLDSLLSTGPDSAIKSKIDGAHGRSAVVPADA